MFNFTDILYRCVLKAFALTDFFHLSSYNNCILLYFNLSTDLLCEPSIAPKGWIKFFFLVEKANKAFIKVVFAKIIKQTNQN